MNTQCIVCEKNIDSPSEFISCSVCNNNYHLNCAEIVENPRRGARNSQWRCKMCPKIVKNNKTKTLFEVTNEQEPSTVKHAKQTIQTPKSANAQSTGTENLQTPSIDGGNQSLLTSDLFKLELNNFKTAIMNFVEEKFGSYTQKYESIIAQNKEILDSIKFLADQQDHLKKRISDIESSQERVNTDMLELKKQNAVLENTTSHQDDKIDRLEYITQMCNIDIRGIPEANNENIMETLKKISKIINYGDTTIPLQSEINKMYRLGPKLSEKNPRSIIVSFNSIKSRDDFLLKIKEYKKSTTSSSSKLNTADLGLSQEAKRIYVSDHLTQKEKFLLSQTKKFARENNYKYHWTSSGRILLRQTDTSKIITIKNIIDLDREKRQQL